MGSIDKIDFPTGSGNDVWIKVYVPSTLYDKNIREGMFKIRITRTQKFLSDKFGGSTRISGIGTWINKKTLIKERVAIVESFSQKKDYMREDLELKKWIKKRLKSWKQHSIAYFYQGKLYFIEEDKLKFN